MQFLVWCRSHIRQACGATRWPESPEVKALGGQGEFPRSGQPGRRANRRAVAKANGLVVEIIARMKLVQAGCRSAKGLLPLPDGQCRCGRTEMHAAGSRRKLKAAILDSTAAKVRKVRRADRTILRMSRTAPITGGCREVAGSPPDWRMRSASEEVRDNTTRTERGPLGAGGDDAGREPHTGAALPVRSRGRRRAEQTREPSGGMAGSALTPAVLRKAPCRTERCLQLEAVLWENPTYGF